MVIAFSAVGPDGAIVYKQITTVAHFGMVIGVTAAHNGTLGVTTGEIIVAGDEALVVAIGHLGTIAAGAA